MKLNLKCLLHAFLNMIWISGGAIFLRDFLELEGFFYSSAIMTAVAMYLYDKYQLFYYEQTTSKVSYFIICLFCGALGILALCYDIETIKRGYRKLRD